MTTFVDLARLTEWMDARGLGDGPVSDVAPLGGGTQNILLKFSRSGREFVLRRPPEHKRPNSDETMRREARVLAALAGTDVPHPRLLAHCPDTEPLGAAFYLMEAVAGFSPWDGMPEPHRSNPAMQHQLGIAMVDALVALAAIDVTNAGLADLGRQGPWLPRQVPRWLAQLESYAAIDGDSGPRLPFVDDVARWLTEQLPSYSASGLMHGDFHFGNVLVRFGQAELAAIVDWELATVGDPLLDFGQLLATWPVPGTVYASRLTAPGLPEPGELVQRYVEATGRDARDVHWFHVLAGLRLGILLEGTHARSRAGQAARATGDVLHGRAVGLLERAAEMCAAEG